MSDSVLPGDKIAIIEEYCSGNNTYGDDEIIRSTVIGQSTIDKKDRIVNVKNLKTISVPQSGDIVIGTVEAVMGSIFVVLVKYVNSKPVKSQVECICSTSNIRRKNIALVNDLVKIKIIGTLNGTIHGTISEPDLGVLFTKCRKCGSEVKPLRDIIKCVECGWTDDRKLSNDFLKTDFIKVGE
ncbi:putative exosome complex RNA-binding protein 1 [Marine Group I thaumarchaeote SCGC AAA799-D07]|nr:putative exosome complex RNA-binding protein 1 [Marine Group I thaumarchaeote SCGC AAA799-D07]